MRKALTPSAKSVTVRDPKGLKFLEVAGAAYNKAGLSEEEAQRVNEAGGLADLVDTFINERRHPLLQLVGTVRVAGAKKFLAKDYIKEANIGYMWDDFKKNFLDKVEENVRDAIITVHSLKKNSRDRAIMDHLGQQTQTTLAHFFALLTKQSQGQEGILLVGGYVNIAYIQDKHGKLWAVRALWNSGRRCWRVSALSVEDPGGWDAGRQVLSSELS